jgi:hypothetical protein
LPRRGPPRRQPRISTVAHTNRYELKYVIDESKAAAVRRFLSAHLRPSPHNDSGPFAGHPVISLYLDSPDLVFFRQAFTGHRNRIKVRIRFYDSDSNRPAFLEIKRRVNEVICKDRAMITREGVRRMLVGLASNTAWPDRSVLVRGKERGDVLEMFWNLCQRVHARGVMYVSYVREIWESPYDDELRVTFDRRLTATPYDGNPLLTVPAGGVPPAPDRPPYYLPRDGVVLELKFEHSAPGWMEHMVRTFDLHRTAVCKYCACLDTMQLQWGKPPPSPSGQEPLALKRWDDCS